MEVSTTLITPSINRTSLITFSSNSVSSVFGFNEYEPADRSLRNLLENGNNKAYRKALLSMAEMDIPNIRTVERKSRVALLKRDDVRTFACSDVVDQREGTECSKQLESQGSTLFIDNIGAIEMNLVSLDIERLTTEFSYSARNTHAMHRGVMKEGGAFEEMKNCGMKVTRVTGFKDTKTEHFTVGSPFDTYSPDPIIPSNGSLGYLVSGRVDGWEQLDDGTKAILEVKTRKNGFREWPWEIYQMVIYMIIHRCHRVRLVQYYNGKIKCNDIIYMNNYTDFWKVLKTNMDALVTSLSEALESKENAVRLIRRVYPMTD